MTKEHKIALYQLASMLQTGELHGGTIRQRAQFVVAIGAAMSPWISVIDRPLFTKDKSGNWVCTEDGEGEFIAAVHYSDADRPFETNLWWIRHCVIEDETGLCVVGEDSNDPAPWDMGDVTHWMPWVKNPPDAQK